MALSRIWSAFIIIAIAVACIKSVFFPAGNRTIFTTMVTGKPGDTISIRKTAVAETDAKIVAFLDSNKGKPYVENGIQTVKNGDQELHTYRLQTAEGIVDTCQTAVTLCLKLIGFMALFMGFMSIAEKAGGIRFLSRLIGPFFSRIFPEIPKGHPSMGHMVMNFSANLLGLDNAATPFGIKAMESLQELNPDKDRASNSQIMFLCLHASGLTLIPVSIIALRSAAGATNPMDIFVPCMIATFFATIAAMIIVSVKQKINLFQPVILGWVLGISALIALLVVYIKSLDTDAVQVFSGMLSSGIILLIFILIILAGLYKKIDVFSSFIDGAKGGFETAVKIIPYLVGMLVAISLLRTSGTFDAVINGMKTLFAAMGSDTRFVDGLPTALVKPFSGGAARGMMVDTMKNPALGGPDSFPARLSCILQGSSDTTFYVIAVYFGAVSVKNTRYAVGAMLLADLVGIITSILLCYFFFG
ncbi:nucleoside recognition domain-containing protein [Ferruginibacter sp. HRS2-29]|uniref:nucleoside recognition domain-containing protein n=1 Tax=Ferruginibacter sp. HRS2-29 TaxID=2487334 RepID=UPI0020CB73D6|nr:spore maturation protein [Ferruginibacter sp. HRS2-29]MCP9751417.1 spore maturation protein [Ferruginibacter sp. HRS2-29]